MVGESIRGRHALMARNGMHCIIDLPFASGNDICIMLPGWRPASYMGFLLLTLSYTSDPSLGFWTLELFQAGSDGKFLMPCALRPCYPLFS